MTRYILIVLMFSSTIVYAQTRLWEPLPLKFEWQVNRLYGDSSSGDLFITSFYGTVDGYDSSLVRWDGQFANFIKTPFGHGYNIIKPVVRLNGVDKNIK